MVSREGSKLFGLDVGSQATERFHVVESNGHREAENTSKPEPKVESKLQSKDNQSDFYSPQIIAEIRALTQAQNYFLSSMNDLQKDVRYIANQLHWAVRQPSEEEGKTPKTSSKNGVSEPVSPSLAAATASRAFRPRPRPVDAWASDASPATTSRRARQATPTDDFKEFVNGMQVYDSGCGTPQFMPNESVHGRRPRRSSAMPTSTRGLASSEEGDMHMLRSQGSEENLAASLPTTIAWPRSVQLRSQLKEASGIDLGQACLVVEEFCQDDMLKEAVNRFRSIELRGDLLALPAVANWVIEPSSVLRMFLDLISIAVLLFDLITTPFVLAWDFPFTGPLRAISWFASAFWTADIFISFRTGFFKNGEMIMSLPAIRHRYMRTFFSLDLMLMCLDWAQMALSYIENVEGSEVTSFAKAARLFRMAKVFRMLRLTELFMRLQDRLKFSQKWKVVLEIVTPFFLILWINHLNACCWYAIAKYLTPDTGDTWLDQPARRSGDPMYSEISTMFQYTTAFHWSITQMTPGSMQVVPRNSVERIFNIACLIFGLVFFSTIISSLSAKLMQWRMLTQETTVKLLVLRRWLNQAKVRPRMAVRVEKQVRERMESKRALTPKDVPVLDTLSLSLKSELMLELCFTNLMSHVLFRLTAQLDLTLLGNTCLEVVDFIPMAPWESLFLAGSDAKRCFKLVQGCVRYKLDHMATRRASITAPVLEEQLVDEGVWISEPALWCTWSHVGTLESASACELLAFGAERLVKEFLKSEVINWFVVDYARQYVTCIHACGETTMPDDLHVPGTEFEELIMCMQTECRQIVGFLALEELRCKPVPTGTWASPITADSRSQALGPRQLQELEQEVKEERSILLSRSNGQVERISIVTVCRIQGVDFKYLAQLGKVAIRDVLTGECDNINTQCRLPGLKQELGEFPDDTLQKLLNLRLLNVLGGSENIQEMERKKVVEVSESKNYGVQTKYIRNVFVGTVKEFFQVPEGLRFSQQPVAPVEKTATTRSKGGLALLPVIQTQSWSTVPFGRPASSSTGSSIAGASSQRMSARWSGFPSSRDRACVTPTDICGVVQDKTMYIFGWLPETEIDYYKNEGEDLLAEILHKICTPQEVCRMASFVEFETDV